MNIDNHKNSDEEIILNKEPTLHYPENEKQMVDLSCVNKKLISKNEEFEKLAGDLLFSNQEFFIQNKEKDRLATELTNANDELIKAKNSISKLNKELEQKINKRTLQYNFIRQINQSIVRLGDEDQLFNESCRIAVEIGKYKMAWIGLFDTVDKKISIISQYGIPKDDVSFFTEIPYDDESSLDYVMRNRTYCVCSATEKYGAVKNWKPFANKHGIASCLVLPIKKSGNIIGTYNLYSTEYNFFNDEEVELMLEVTADISFAIDIFDKEQKLKSTEQSLLTNEKRFCALIENSVDMVTLSTEQGNIFYVSPSITKHMGYTIDDCDKVTIFDLIHPDDKAFFMALREQILETPDKIAYSKLRIRHKNGHWVWCEGTHRNLLHEKDINAIVANYKDISERIVAEKQQEFDQNNLDALINCTGDLMCTVDKDFNLISANQAYDDYIQKIAGEPIKKGNNILISPFSSEILNRYRQYFERAFMGEAFKLVEYIDTELAFWAEVSFYPIRKGDKIVGSACHVHDVTQMKLNEQTIKDERLLLRTLIDNLPITVYTKDIQSRKTLSNRMDYECLGVHSEEEVLGKDDTWFFSEESARATHIEDQHIFKTGESIINSEEYLTKKDGSTVWFLKSKIPLRNQNNEIVGLLGISNDITERKKGEERIRKSEAFNRSVLNSLRSHIAVIKNNGKIIAINESWKLFVSETSNKNLEHCGVGSNYFEVCMKSALRGDDIAAEALQGMKDVIAKKKDDFYFEYPCHSPNGKKWFGMRVMKFEDDEQMIVVAHENVTTRILAEENLHLTQFALETAADCVFWIRPDARIVKVNEAACIMLGYEREELLQLSIPDIDPMYNKAKWPIHFEELRQKGSLFFETIQNTKDGRIIPIEVRANYINYGDTEFNCAFIRDITERKIAEEERKKITEDIVQRNKDLEQFSYIISHNLRAPVANIIGLSMLVKEPDLDPDTKKDVMDGLSLSINKLDEVINDLNNILQVKREISQKKEKIYFSEIVSNIQISIRNVIEKENAKLIWDFSDIDEMLTLKGYLHSIFYNLISNSLKYRQPNIPPIIEIKSQKLNNKIVLTFKDNGMGIDLKRKGDQVFGLYKRFHTESAEGKGVGLYMVKTQVETLGGNISIESEINIGTEIKIEF